MSDPSGAPRQPGQLEDVLSLDEAADRPVPDRSGRSEADPRPDPKMVIEDPDLCAVREAEGAHMLVAAGDPAIEERRRLEAEADKPCIDVILAELDNHALTLRIEPRALKPLIGPGTAFAARPTIALPSPSPSARYCPQSAMSENLSLTGSGSPSAAFLIR